MNTLATGSLISQARREKGLTQSDLASALHVSTQAVSKWERGLNFPDITLLEPLGELLGLTVSELMAGEKDSAPREELVRESVRLGSSQLGGRVKKWRRLFFGAAAVLLTLGAVFGYIWVRDNTNWLPQRDTILTSVEIGEMDALIAHLSGQRCFAAYDLTLADGLEKYGVRIEHWTSEGLVSATDALGFYPAGGENPRHQTLAFSLQEENSELTANIISGGFSASPYLGTVPEDAAWGAMTPNETTAVPEEGVVLLYIAISRNAHSVSIPASLEPTELEQYQSVILLRLVAE